MIELELFSQAKITLVAFDQLTAAPAVIVAMLVTTLPPVPPPLTATLDAAVILP
jgi:hypothetical protein